MEGIIAVIIVAVILVLNFLFPRWLDDNIYLDRNTHENENENLFQ